MRKYLKSKFHFTFFKIPQATGKGVTKHSSGDGLHQMTKPESTQVIHVKRAMTSQVPKDLNMVSQSPSVF
jgi:hypothetical protein